MSGSCWSPGPLVQPSHVTVMETSPWEGVVLERTGDMRVGRVGAQRILVPPLGSELTCWLLPTLVPAEHLLVRWMVPAPW